MIKEIIEIQSKDSGRRIESVCAEYFPEYSRTKWTQNGTFICNGKEKPGKTKGKTGEIWNVECTYSERISSHLKPWNHTLNILKESHSWVAIEKPIGIAVHPSVSDPSQKTIVNALVYQFGQQLSESSETIDGKNVSRPGLVHRLDKGTSGVLLVAKTNATHRYLQTQWEKVTKIYFAVVRGVVPRRGRIEGGIHRDPSHRQKMTVSTSEKAKEAETRFERIACNHQKSLIRVTISTGRTHQIRVHLSEIGFPIIGDSKYGSKSSTRIFLHASELHFPDPDQEGKIIRIVSPVPSEFETQISRNIN
jgi:23S rRNA pseudouridine1911/1915/1917 synthase